MASDSPRILLFGSEENAAALRDSLSPPFAAEVVAEPKLQSAAARLAGESFDLVAAWLSEGKAESLAALCAADGDVPVLVVAERPSVELAAECLRAGAGDFVTADSLGEQFAASARRLLSQRRRRAEYALLRRQVERPYGFDDMIGGCPAMRAVFDLIDQVAASDVDVLVIGETGTGKELVARSVHSRSRRAASPFVPVDCGAIPENLLESEFFGHEKGTFTGADSRRIGLLEFADRGTIFLDELGELPLSLQAKLLRTLQERRIRRVGGREELPIDVRIVAATARSLDEMIRLGQFRQDLFYRINVVRVDLPPLRERGDDIGLLAEFMVNRAAREMQREVRGITPEAYQVLSQYRWPGNVRELNNVIRRGVALTRGSMLGLDDLPDELVASAGQRLSEEKSGYFRQRDEHLARFEQQYLEELLARHKGDVRTAAQEARLPRGTLYRLMKKYALDGAKFR